MAMPRLTDKPWMLLPAPFRAAQVALAQLEGTPFGARQARPGRGGGVDCVTAVLHVVRAVGVRPVTPLPRYRLDGGAYATACPIEDYVRHDPVLRAHVVAIDADEGSPLKLRHGQELLFGDVLLWRDARVPWHLSLHLGNGHHGHAVIDHGWLVDDLATYAARARLVRAWRLVEVTTSPRYAPLPHG